MRIGSQILHEVHKRNMAYIYRAGEICSRPHPRLRPRTRSKTVGFRFSPLILVFFAIRQTGLFLAKSTRITTEETDHIHKVVISSKTSLL